MRHWAAALAGLLVAIPLAAADPLDGHDCFSSDNDRRIKGCTELIERPEVTGQLLGSAEAVLTAGEGPETESAGAHEAGRPAVARQGV